MSEAATVSKVDEKKDDKPSVDNATLAFMLRESADIVEKGEFDVILYHALQDFRTYYKLHLPKRKEKAKKKPAAAATAPADSGENSSDAAATSSSDAQKEANTKPAEMTGEATPPTVSADPSTQELPAEQSKSDNSARETSAGATVISEEGTESRTTPSTSDPPASSSKLQVDGPESAAVEPGAPENPINTESGRMGSMDSVLDSGRSAEDFDNEASLRDAQAKQNHFAPFGKKAKNTGSKISAGMFASKTKMKLPKKLPKIHVNLPSSGKKKREAELADLTGGEVAQYAESSRRRAAVGGEDGNDAVMQSPQRSSKLAPAVTGLDDKEIRSTSATNPVDRVREDEPADAENEKPSSLRNNETHNATNNSASVHPTTATASAPSTASSSEVFVADPRSESFEYEMPDHGHGKPAFQRPKNKNSAVVANGWIEQQRRSKMRTVWKEVLASLVQGRRPGEETTLWIQREAVDPTTGKKELEALHQVPVKLLESVVYSEYTTDDRFSLKLYNSHEEFVFRCNNDPSAAMNWVTILQQFEMETKQNGAMPPPTAPTESVFPDFPEEKKGPDVSERSSSPTPNRLAIRDLRAICHGAGINTVGMERANLERAAAEVQKRGTYFAPPSAGHAAVPPIPPAAAAAPVGASTGSASTARSASPLPPKSSEPSAPVSNGATGHKMSIKDLRAICHGAGISTVGMERGELERAAAEVQKRGTYFAPPPGAVPPVAPRPGADAQPEDEAGKKEEIRQKQAAEDEARRRAAEEEHWRRHEEESRRRAAEDEHRRRAEEEHRRRAAEEERRRRMAEQQARQAEDQRRRYMEQQAAWQHQQQQEEQRRRLAEQQAAEHRRIHEENMRKQQQWGGQQPQHHPQGWSQHHHPHPHQHYQQHPQQQHWTPQQQQQWHQQQQRHQQYPQQHAPPRGPSPQQHPPQEQSKYAKMANQTDDDGQAAITKLKHDILIQWALQPPQLQMLRSVDVLLSTIQTVFPPALGVPAHDYFRKWKVVTRESVLSDVGIIDEEKVKKAVRKLRFFLHPDKLPKDLNKEQEFMVKMLWDITNDAWEEYEKSKADLDWVK